MKRDGSQIAALAALFVGPLAVALLLYAGRDIYGGFEMLPNPDRGLVEPPRVVPLKALELRGGGRSDEAWARSRWVLIYARMPACEGQCDGPLERVHQVFLALGGERDRVRLVFLAPADAEVAGLPAGFLVGDAAASANSELIQVLGPERLAAGGIFVVDPLGNFMLSYPPGADQDRLLRDLERLLEVSRIG